MRLKKEEMVVGVMNKSNHNFLRTLLISLAFVNLVGMVWFFHTLSEITFFCGATLIIASFFLGIIGFQTKKTAFWNSVLAVFAIAGTIASVVRVFYAAYRYCDLWAAVPHLFSLILFAVVLKNIIKERAS